MTTTTDDALVAPATADQLRRLYVARFVFAAVIDVRASRNPVLYANIAISVLAVTGIAVASADDIPAVLRVWGVWAVTAGLVQLIVAVRRRVMGGQWPMMLAGGISLFAGTSFILSAGSATSLSKVAGYAALGGLFFLVSAVTLYRQSRSRRVAQAV